MVCSLATRISNLYTPNAQLSESNCSLQDGDYQLAEKLGLIFDLLSLVRVVGSRSQLGIIAAD